ncbi:MAG TPA: squalene synthase HpnC [Candidatus Kapabacteria bacterium]|nr:squalene synthase HpnC [Candidatus Kapabacteria bacterium]
MTDLDNAYAECRRIALGHYENFPVGSLLIPRNLRKHFFALYAFMRSADDFADLPHRPGYERLRLLYDWRAKLHSIYDETIPVDPIFLALRDTIQKFDLPRAPFDLLLDAFEFDANNEVRFETFNDLRWYTKRSAEPVGELVLWLFDYWDAERIRWSNDICTALQLLNFLQDAKEDLLAGRYYFPREVFRQFGIAKEEEIISSEQFGELVLHECNRIEGLLRNGVPLIESVRGWLKLELRAVVSGAKLMLGKIRAMNGNTIDARPKLSAFEKRRILFDALKKSTTFQ